VGLDASNPEFSNTLPASSRAANQLSGKFHRGCQRHFTPQWVDLHSLMIAATEDEPGKLLPQILSRYSNPARCAGWAR